MSHSAPGPVVLGRKYRDTITGFEGTATSRHEYLYGCVRISLEGCVDGKPDELSFDEQRLVGAETAEQPAATATSGGPRPIPPRRGLRY